MQGMKDIYKGRTQLHLEMVQKIERIKTGIEGLDELVGGGIPKKFSVLVSGSPGTGKSILGLQFLCYGAGAGENGVFVTFAEPKESIIIAGERLNLGPAALEKAGKLNIIEYFEIGNEETLEQMSKIGKEIDEIVKKKKDDYDIESGAMEFADDDIKKHEQELADLSEVMLKERHGAAAQQREAHFFALLESIVKEKNIKRREKEIKENDIKRKENKKEVKDILKNHMMSMKTLGISGSSRTRLRGKLTKKYQDMAKKVGNLEKKLREM